MEYELTLTELIGLIKRQFLVIAGVTTLGTLAAIVYALTATPVFRAETTLAPIIEDGNQSSFGGLSGQFGSFASLAGLSFRNSSDIENAKATLVSRAFTEKFINDHNLLPRLFEDAWDEESQTWLATDGVEATGPTSWQAYRVFNNLITLSEDQQSSLIRLSIDWTDPELAAAWVNSLVEAIDDHIREQDVAEAQKSIEYLTAQLEETNVVEMQQVLYNLIETQTRTVMLANVRDDYVFEVIDPAVIPEEKFRPQRRLIVIIGFSLSLFASLIAIVLVDLSRPQNPERAKS